MLHWGIFSKHIPFILSGFFITLKFTFFSLLFGIPLAILLAGFKYSSYRHLSFFGQAYTALFRGTPLLVQLFLIHWGIMPLFFKGGVSPFLSGIITFSLNSAAYSSEILFAGIKAIDTGQWDAAYTLGLSKYQTYRYIILPQVIRNNLPQLMNEFIDLLKESALISTIGAVELFRKAQYIANSTYLMFESYFFVALVYFIFILFISILQKVLEKKC